MSVSFVPMTPSSVATSGGSASIIGTGTTFTSASAVSLNGVFTSAHENYFYVVRGVGTGNENILIRLRAAGSDNTSNEYMRNRMVYGSSLNINMETQTTLMIGYVGNHGGNTTFLAGPQLASNTGFWCHSGDGTNGSYAHYIGARHNVATSYDGVTLLVNSGTFTGRIQVYGLAEA